MLTKSELLRRLKGRLSLGDTEWYGQRVAIETLIGFFEKKEISEHEEDGLIVNLPRYAAQAFAELSERVDTPAKSLRQEFKAKTGFMFPSLIEIAKSPLTERRWLVKRLGEFLAEITGWPRLGEEMEYYCLAQDKFLQQTFDKFLIGVHEKGLQGIIKEYRPSGLESRFGRTTLQIIFPENNEFLIFSREDLSDNMGMELIAFAKNQSGVFIPQTVKVTRFYTAIDMIEEVIYFWPTNTEDQKTIFKIF